MRPRVLISAIVLAVLAPLGSASAAFKVCNKTEHQVGLAIAHTDGLDWISEGWWNIAAHSCMTVLDGPLKARYYYLYAVHYGRIGGWVGDRYFCTSKRSFTITGREDCAARGFQRTGFFEVDTRKAADYTETLTDPGKK